METGLALVALQAINELLKLINSEKQSDYAKLLEIYEQQTKLPFDHKDFSDDLLANTIDRLRSYVDEIRVELSKK